MEKEIVSAEKVKPVRDEQTLAQLLEAAYVLQEHNREMLEMELRLDLKPDQLEPDQLKPDPLKKDQREAEEKSSPSPRADTSPTPASQPLAHTDYTSTLAEIVSTQQQIQVRHLELDDAMSLVAERLTQIARASGAVVGLLHGKRVRYRAMFGLTLPVGTEVPMEQALCFACLQTGQVFRCADVRHEERLDTEECRWRGIQSLIAVPIFHDGEVAGGLELYYPSPRAFTEHDVHTCQLMAGLVTEALARDQEVALKKSLASERAVMLEALEKLKPNLAALVDVPIGKDTALKAAAPAPAAAAATPIFACPKCGHQLVGEEHFCGNCGTPRGGDYEAPSMQSKVASPWQVQETMKNASPGPEAKDEPARAELDPDLVSVEKADSLEKPVPEFLAAGLPHDQKIESTPVGDPRVSADFEDSVFSDFEIPLASSPTENEEIKSPEPTALAPAARATAWSSAATAREFLEQLASARRPGSMARLWNTHRGDIYLAIAVILVAGVICWGVWSTHTVGATGSAAAAAIHHKPAPDAGLSLFDRMLVSLGLAEPPAAPEYKGNPATQVWVDLHTALYYCPGADLYGKTPKGKFASQRDAQLDQFEPASRKACD